MKKLVLYLIAVCCILYGTVPVCASAEDETPVVEMKFIAAEDTYVQRGNASDFSSKTELALKYNVTLDEEGNIVKWGSNNREIFLKFDLSELEGEVIKAELILTRNKNTEDSKWTPQLCEVGYIPDDLWSAKEIQWGTTDETDNRPEYIDTGVQFEAKQYQDEVMVSDVTELVQSDLSEDTSKQLSLKVFSVTPWPQDGPTFYAKEANKFAPTLSISYKPDYEKVAREDAEKLNLGDLSAVTRSLTLPDEGESGTEIVWKSSQPDILAENGTVHRPEKTTDLILSAFVNHNGKVWQRDFEVTVLAQGHGVCISPDTVITINRIEPQRNIKGAGYLSEEELVLIKFPFPDEIEGTITDAELCFGCDGTPDIAVSALDGTFDANTSFDTLPPYDAEQPAAVGTPADGIVTLDVSEDVIGRLENKEDLSYVLFPLVHYGRYELADPYLTVYSVYDQRPERMEISADKTVIKVYQQNVYAKVKAAIYDQNNAKIPGEIQYRISGTGVAINEMGQITVQASAPSQKAIISAQVSGYPEINAQLEIEIIKMRAENGSSGGGSGGRPAGASGAGGSGAVSYPSAVQPANEPEPTQIPPKSSFKDMVAAVWAQDAVEELAERKIINGVGQGLFEPMRPITRAEFAAMTVKAFALSTNGAKAEMPDVHPEDWFFEDIQAAVQTGLLRGFEDGSLRPNEPILRQDMCVLIARLFEPEEGEFSEVCFADDGEIAEYARQSVYYLRGIGIINGDSDNLLYPDQYLTRAEAAQVMHNLLNREV